MDGVVIGGEVIAIDGGDPGTTRVGDGVGDKTKVVGTATEKAVGGVASTIQIEAAEFEIGRAGRETAAAKIEHSGGISRAVPDNVNRAIAIIPVDDPRRGRAAGVRFKGRGQRIVSTEKTDDGAGSSGCGSASEGLCGSGARPRICILS